MGRLRQMRGTNWIRKAQHEVVNGDVFISDKQRLDFGENQDKLYECRGRRNSYLCTL